MQGGSIPDAVRLVAARAPGAVAVLDEAGALSYGELTAAVEVVADRLAERGVRRGERVLLSGVNSVAWVVAALAVLRCGATVAPLSHLAGRTETAAALASVAPVLAVADDPDRLAVDEMPVGLPLLGLASLTAGASAAAVELPAPVGSDVALLLASSGTGGPPSRVPMTHAQLLRLYGDLSHRLALTPADRLMCAVPLAHSFGFNGVLLIGLLAGAGVRLLPRWEPANVATMLARGELTRVFGPPTLYRDLEQHADVLAGGTACRTAVAGGSEVDVGALRRAGRVLGAAELVVGYGLTETCGTVATGDVGYEGPAAAPPLVPMPGTEVRAVDPEGVPLPPGSVGELEVRGYQVVIDASDASDTAAGGWLRTGDLGHLDPEGRVAVDGRVKDLIVVSGHNVAPREVEAVLIAHPAVDGAAVVGVPDERRGERVVAAVTTVDGAPLDPADLLRHARRYLAPHQVPSRVVHCEELPRTATGKLARAQVRALVDR